MNKMAKVILLALLVLTSIFIPACRRARTNIRSYTEASAWQGTVYKNIMVCYMDEDIPLRKMAEDAFAERIIHSTKSSASPSLDSYPPSQNINVRELKQLSIDLLSYDAVLFIEITGMTKEYVFSGHSYEGSGRTRGANYPYAAFKTELYDTKSKKLVWVASGETVGASREHYKAMTKSMAKSVVNMLEYDGLLK